MDRLEAMSVIIAVAETGSFSAASRRLKSPVATVSRKVAEFESRLKAQLFQRTSRRMTLTDAGRSYIEACKRIIEQADEAEREVSGEYRMPKGELAVTAPWGLGHLHLLPHVVEFLEAYPDISLRLILTDEVINMVDENIAIAIRVGSLPDSSMIATRIGAVRHVICGSPSFLAYHGVPDTPSALAELACISHEFLTALGTAWPFREPGAKVDIMAPVRVRLAVTTAEAAIDAAVAGIGVTRLLSYQVAEAVARGALRIVLEQYEREPIPVSILHAGPGMLPLKVRTFRDFAAPRLRAALGEAKLNPPSQAS